MILAIWFDLSGEYEIEYVLKLVLETSRGILTSF